jgi:hypothetical protein
MSSSSSGSGSVINYGSGSDFFNKLQFRFRFRFQESKSYGSYGSGSTTLLPGYRIQGQKGTGSRIGNTDYLPIAIHGFYFV